MKFKSVTRLLLISSALAIAQKGHSQPTPVAIEQIAADSYFKDFMGEVPYHLDDGWGQNVTVHDNRFLRLYGRPVDDLAIDIREDNHLRKLEINLLDIGKDTTFFKQKLDELYKREEDDYLTEKNVYRWVPATKPDANAVSEARLDIDHGRKDPVVKLTIYLGRRNSWYD